jgi:hypothetical protein
MRPILPSGSGKCQRAAGFERLPKGPLATCKTHYTRRQKRNGNDLGPERRNIDVWTNALTLLVLLAGHLLGRVSHETCILDSNGPIKKEGWHWRC